MDGRGRRADFSRASLRSTRRFVSRNNTRLGRNNLRRIGNGRVGIRQDRFGNRLFGQVRNGKLSRVFGFNGSAEGS